MTTVSADAAARQQRIAEETVHVIDYTSRVLGAVERGNWRYAADKLPGLVKAVQSLALQIDMGHANELQLIRGEAVWTKVETDATYYWLGRMIFPRAQQESSGPNA